MTMWTVQQYSAGSNQWGVQAAKVMAPPPATPTSVSRPILPSRRPSVVLSVTARRRQDRGFFDPDPSFGCHMAATFDGGVTVTEPRTTLRRRSRLTVSTVGAPTDRTR